ncbi:N-6 DNA methylase [Chloroflexales bacterium ZM16-3]|nr:N-6 DNA methylase [Chloroflexales bacterium ZM16-3]
MSNFQDKVSFIWSVADEVLRDDFKRGKYPDVILPFTVLRRLDCVLQPTRDKVRERYAALQGKGLSNLDGQLRKAAGHSFYNTSPYDFPRLLQDGKNIGTNLRTYINGFSENMREVIEKFKLRSTIDTLEEKGLLFQLIQKFSAVDLHPDTVSNHTMGTIFEELIRKFNEQMNENPGEHFTPREVIRLMVRLLLDGDAAMLQQQSVIRTVYDPCAGSGGMLSTAKEYVLGTINATADLRLFGQEVNDETFAICTSDMLIKGDDRDAENIKPESSLSRDGHPHATFDYMLSNPPYGKDWKKEQKVVEDEAERGDLGRFAAGTPRISDGQLLFLQHMISKRKPPEEGGSRIAIVHNGSPLFTGDAGSGESEIRRWILEHDWLEAIVALPGQLFYNTGITTYIWVLSNRKPPQRAGKVLLVNGAATRMEGDKEVEVFARKMRRSLGDKRNELSDEHIAALAALAAAFADGPYTKVFATTDFGYRKITVERPLRLNFQVSPERLARLREEKAFLALAGKRKDAAERARSSEQAAILAALGTLAPAQVWKRRDAFEQALDAAIKKAGLKLAAPLRKAVLSALGERDETAEICRDARGNPEPDPELRDFENVPLSEGVDAYFAREVLPHVPDAWVNQDVRDPQDGQVGKVGYEISFTRYFYQYQPPRPLAAIDAEIKALEDEIAAMLQEVTQ